MFWERPRRGYIELCLETLRRHYPDVRLLDRAAFEALWTEDSDLPRRTRAQSPVRLRTTATEVLGFVGYREPQASRPATG
jgi:hypothetical protein